MITLTAGEIALLIGGELHCDSDLLVFKAPVFDSRLAIPGSFFLALEGEVNDGHDFVAEAYRLGAVFSLTTHTIDGPCIVVRDVIAALSTVATFIRARLNNLTVIGITGSQGKTGTKDLLAHMLAAVGPTVAPTGSFNNDLGLPLTLLECDERTRFCILEMGARHKGDIKRLCEIAKPNIGVVLTVGTAHLGEFGSQEVIAETKGELIASLGENGIAILGTYDEFTPAMAKLHNGKVLTFGERNDVDVRATDIEIREGRAHFDLVTRDGRDAVGLRSVGAHQVANALAVAAVGTALALPIELIASSLSTAAIASKWRMELHEVEELLIINDSYNANPASMSAALHTLALFAQLEAQRALAQYTEQLAKAQAEAQVLREDARVQGASIIEDLRAKAQEEAARITATAHATIEAEPQHAITSHRTEVGALAVELASKIVGESLDDAARQSRVVDRFLEDLEKSK